MPLHEEYRSVQGRVMFLLEALQALQYEYQSLGVALTSRAMDGLNAQCVEIQEALEAFEARLATEC